MISTDQTTVVELSTGQLLQLELESYDAVHNRKPALKALSGKGDIVWVANFPVTLPFEADDSLVAVSAEAGRIFVNSWKCWRYEIEPVSGIAISKTFTK